MISCIKLDMGYKPRSTLDHAGNQHSSRTSLKWQSFSESVFFESKDWPPA